MFIALILSLIAIALILLVVLAVIDARTMLLPDHYVFLFGLSGIALHIMTNFGFMSPQDALLGALVGGGGMYLVRMAGNYIYKQESMGLGDVKLLLAGGLWVGGMGTVWAITLGAFCTLIFAAIYAIIKGIKTGKFSFARLVFPAGPGFCAGLAFIIFMIYLRPAFYV